MKTETIFGTVDANFAIALEQEEVLTSLPRDDPYRFMAQVNVEYYLNCAALLELGIHRTETKMSVIERMLK